jgi:steroid 5-alpha reductase family enzyme
MWKTALLLLVTLIIVPFAFIFDVPLTDLQMETLRILVILYLAAATLAFILSTITGNYSQVDKLWSTIPVAYVWIIAAKSGFEARPVLMALMVTLWAARLTYNFNRRGGFTWRFWTGEEDYRWPILRKKPEFAAKWKWTLFNFFFISFYQMAIILLFTLPALKSMGSGALTGYDLFLAAVIVALVIVETVADQQQWNFHKEKSRLKTNGKPLPENYAKGFVDTGLWGMVRHPNYAAEQGIWIVFYFYSVIATGSWINWSLTGAILLVILFKGSSDFSESISAGKYPKYVDYIKSVPRFIPIKFGKVPVEEEETEDLEPQGT